MNAYKSIKSLYIVIHSMKHYFIYLFAFFCLHATAQDKKQDFDALKQLAGKWHMQTNKGMLYEEWIQVNDSLLKGKSFRVNNTDTVMLESVELKLAGNNIYYIPVTAHQNNQQPVMFTLIRTENKQYVFENKIHDFPQRVVYEIPEGGKLHAWIEGNINGSFKRSDYHYEAL